MRARGEPVTSCDRLAPRLCACRPPSRLVQRSGEVSRLDCCRQCGAHCFINVEDLARAIQGGDELVDHDRVHDDQGEIEASRADQLKDARPTASVTHLKRTDLVDHEEIAGHLGGGAQHPAAECEPFAVELPT